MENCMSQSVRRAVRKENSRNGNERATGPTQYAFCSRKQGTSTVYSARESNPCLPEDAFSRSMGA